jgi:hypothetical protein
MVETLHFIHLLHTYSRHQWSSIETPNLDNYVPFASRSMYLYIWNYCIGALGTGPSHLTPTFGCYILVEFWPHMRSSMVIDTQPNYVVVAAVVLHLYVDR